MSLDLNKCLCGCGKTVSLRKNKYIHGHNPTNANANGKMSLSNNPNWNGGKNKNWAGYISMRVVGHPYANKQGYVKEHRLVMEKKLGRYLLPHEIVHHINHIKDDNRIENLMLTTVKEHLKEHRIKKEDLIKNYKEVMNKTNFNYIGPRLFRKISRYSENPYYAVWGTLRNAHFEITGTRIDGTLNDRQRLKNMFGFYVNEYRSI